MFNILIENEIKLLLIEIFRSEQCSSECGTGQQFRTIFCDRSPPYTERCDVRLTPNTFRECTSNVRCEGEWFIGPWSLCSGDCFNSSRSRTVVCIKNDGFAEESECDLKAKPVTFEDCQPEDMKDCKPKWHSSEWTEVNLIKCFPHRSCHSLSSFQFRFSLRNVKLKLSICHFTVQ